MKFLFDVGVGVGAKVEQYLIDCKFDTTVIGFAMGWHSLFGQPEQKPIGLLVMKVKLLKPNF